MASQTADAPPPVGICRECDLEVRFCPCCGEPLADGDAKASESSGPDITVVLAKPTTPRPGPGQEPGAFADRVSKRIRRTISGKE